MKGGKMTKKEQLIDQMKMVAAQINVAHIKRNTGEYISMTEVRKLERKFANLQRQHKKLYFQS
jgi:hypothetical protein